MRGHVLAGAWLAVLVSAALAGPEFVEPKGMDAGSLPGSAGPTVGDGPMTAIRGKLQGVSLGPGTADLQDLYLICIDDPSAFFASTVEVFGGFAQDFDSRLYLFDMNGNGVLANDNTASLVPGFSTGSTLLPSSDDGTGSFLQTPGLYLLAVCIAPQAPSSPGGPMFFLKIPTEISGPDGSGGGAEVVEWVPIVGACCFVDGCQNLTPEDCQAAGGFYVGDNTSCQIDACPVVGACVLLKQFCVETTEKQCDALGGFYLGDGVDCPGPPPPPLPPPPGKAETGEYKIMLEGACFSSDVVVGACLLYDGKQAQCVVTDNLSCAFQKGEFLGEGTSCCEGDVNGDLVVDVLDLVAVLLEWGCDEKKQEFCQADVTGDGVVDVLDLVVVVTSWGPCQGR
jgi:hypothetical protein